MRVLILDHYYPAFAAHWYAAHPGLAEAPYAEQRRSFESAMLGATAFEVAALRALGHEAEVAIINTEPAQRAWAREHGVPLPPSRRRKIARRGGLIPWPVSVEDGHWIETAIRAQVADFRPDVVHIQCMNALHPSLVPKLKLAARLVTGQIAAPIGMWRVTAGYDLVVSSLPNYVARFREAGVDAASLALAFEPSVLRDLGPINRDVAVSFVGSIQRSHGARAELLDAVAAAVDVDVWTPDAANLAPDSPLRRRLHPEAWGVEMYRVLGASRVTINRHIDIAEEYANNLRLYEATGMGALLITDAKVNLGELFDIGSEVVAYDDARDCAEKVRYYVDHPDEAAAIAAAGQRRTTREHTWGARMARLVQLFEARL